MRTLRLIVAVIVLLAPASFTSNCPAACTGDLNGNGSVGIDDLLGLIGDWGPCAGCPADLDGNGVVNVADLLLLIAGWGGCPTGACCLADGTCTMIAEALCPFASQGAYAGDGVPCGAVFCPIRPANDECINAAVAVTGVNVWDNTFAFTDPPPVPAACAFMGLASRDVWFNYTSTCTGFVTFDTLGTLAPFFDTVIQVFSGTGCNPVGALLGCNDDIAAPGMLLSSVTVNLVTGQTVKIRCMSWGVAPANEGPALLNIACMPLNNDLCVDAALMAPLTVPSTVAGTLVGATPDAAPVCAGVVPGFGRWHTVIGTGGFLTASTCDSPFEPWDGALSVYSGPGCGALVCVGASSALDCGPGGMPGLQEIVIWPSVAGVKYWILVHTVPAPAPPDGNYVLKVF